MIYLISMLIFLLTIIAIIVSLKIKINKRYDLVFQEVEDIESKFKELKTKENQLKEKTSNEEEDAERIHSIYEATKEMSEFLDDEKIMESFKEGLNKFIKLDECKFIASIDNKIDLSGFEIFPLISETASYGYLAIKGSDKEERAILDTSILDILIAQLVTNIKRARLYDRVQALAITDSLTKVFTRNYSLDRYEEEFRRSQEFNLTMSFAMIDIDNFKTFNDRYGHLVGDAVLKSIADNIKANCREIDLIGRFGGEEFMVVMPMTSKDGAIFAAERIRKSIESNYVKAFDESLQATVSIGVASYPQDSKSSHELIDKADWALYRSKRMGKNKVSAFATYK